MNQRPQILVEACVTTPDEARRAIAAGAHRLEYCHDLACGGVTPDVEETAGVCADSAVPVCVMIRPRGGSFHMTPQEISRMLTEVEVMTKAGVAGIVLGILTAETRIDEVGLRELVDAAGALPVTFHKAFDELSDLDVGLEILMDCGVQRLLTSGGAPTALEGSRQLAGLVQSAAGGMTVMAGGSVRGDHVNDLITATGVSAVHARGEGVPAIVEALR